MRRLFAAAPLVALFASCSDTPPTGRPTAMARFLLPAGSTAARLLDVPYPDMLLARPLVGIEAVAPANGARIVHELDRLDGASRFTMALFRVDAPDGAGGTEPAVVDPASLPATEEACTSPKSSVFLVDLAPEDPSRARIPCRAAYKDDRRWGSDTPPVLAIGPARGVVLEEGHEYAAVLTSRVTIAGGAGLEPSPDFRAIARGERSDPPAAALAQSLDAITARLGGVVRRDEIVAVARFRTHTRSQELFELRAALDAEPPPTLRWDAPALAPMGAARFAKRDGMGALPAGFTASLDEWLGVVAPEHVLADGADDWDNTLPVHGHNRVSAFGTAVIDAPSFLQELGGYDVFDHATFRRKPDGSLEARPERTTKIWLSFAVPDAPMPPSGYPTVIVQHGMGSSRLYLLDLMNAIAREGWIAVTIDSITFGARAVDRSKVADVTTDSVGRPGATYDGPDGIADRLDGAVGPVDLFGNLVNLGAMRDQLRQAALDTATVVRVLAADPDLSPLATTSAAPRVDASRIVYIGESLGSVEGELAAAIVPEVKSWIFSVGGGGVLLEAGTHGPGIASLLAVGAGLTFGRPRDRFDEYHPLVTLAQTAIEPGDPLLYAAHLVKQPRLGTPRNVLQIEVLNDELLSNEGNEAYARAGGFFLATPNEGSNAGVRSLPANPQRGGLVPLPVGVPGADGALRDVPAPGVTAVLLQAGPADHGSDMVASKGTIDYAIPFYRPDETIPFRRLARPFQVRNPYREIVGSITRFLRDGFEGKTPGAVVLAPPRRDFDDDGVPDGVDPDPSDPTVR